MKVNSGFDENRARIELIPLLDVLLIVLIFFVYLAVSMTAQKSIGLNLPSGKGETTGRAVTVTIDRTNRIFVNGLASPADSVVQRVFAAARAFGDGPPDVVLRSDRDSSLGTSVELLSRLRDAGIPQVSVEVQER
ncbi:MAG TPA: biopolymer transporter ExbD [Spirochaetia bacterium]|nr:biopolymer transporter ExbD [Spirochaetia bacterium]